MWGEKCVICVCAKILTFQCIRSLGFLIVVLFWKNTNLWTWAVIRKTLSCVRDEYVWWMGHWRNSCQFNLWIKYHYYYNLSSKTWMGIIWCGLGEGEELETRWEYLEGGTAWKRCGRGKGGSMGEALYFKEKHTVWRGVTENRKGDLGSQRKVQ